MEASGEQLSRDELAESVEFCMRVIQKVDGTMNMSQNSKGFCEENHGELTCDRIKKEELKSDLNKFGVDVVNGMTVNLQRGALGLVKAA